ncbi:hypothetical protein BO78DRAFT_357097 [Aspergillus sclerotiicarbonarius CBS 121057]|uniref:Methyltransferase domain-containing protein n=1 Tax=Aspergillus sclerotiicarbonarius (strain CBS 121057 / IBT 28362) TaxID=1448318 RepID=A0A319ETC3_ASPSB|nr:hypothetical protein BO78DRAFT_357097 [Aspergillus sclerotiicarbonarius CBS 121057]
MSQGSSREDDTQSLTASVMDYPVEYGRRYHRYHEGAYLYPNDEQELDRMDMQHHMLKLVNDGRMLLAPAQNPKRILDIGTGSGIWPIELASEFPAAEIIGTDLSPVQPNEVPENVHFLVDDATEDDWLWGPNHFDVIHAGHLSGSLPSYKDLLRKVFKHLKPGGYVQCDEFDPKPKCDDETMPPEDPDKFSDYALQDLMDLHVRSGHVSDPPRQFRVAHRFVRWMREVGFEDVQARVCKVPVNPWSTDSHLRTIGSWHEANLLEAIAGWSYKPLTILGWSKPEIEVFLVDVRKSIQNRDVHAYMDYYVVTGRKPRTAHEEFLASAFRRFANGQRRYESRVPGPLEARRRLAKRRNTALAGIAGTGPLDDIACLFGRNGREHLKWTDGRKAPRETKGSHFYQLSTPPPPPPVYNENVDPDEFKPPGWPEVPDGADEVSRDQYLKRRLRECHTVSSVKRVVRQLDIDLLREPGYSRLIFDHLLSCSVRGELAVGELTSFLDDPHLNIRGARNYLTAVEHVVLRGTSHAKWRTLFDNVIQALELGLIPPEELCAIIETLPKSTPAKSGKGRQPLYSVTVMYQAMWDAIGRCDIYGHNDLDEGLVDAWLGAMWERNVCEDLPLAKSILLAAQNLESACCSWATLFITRWLELPKRLRVETDEVYASEILSSLKPDAAAAAIISTTEFLMSSKKTSLLGRWHSCLSQIQEIPSLVSSNPWIDIESQCDVPESTFSPQHQIILRLWALRTLSRSLPDGPLWRKDVRATDIPITRLLSLYELFRKDVAEHDMLSSLMKGIHDLSMPANGLLMLAVDLKARNSITRSTRQTLTKLETSNISFADVFADLGAYNSMAPHFFSKFEKMARQIDITSPEFIEHGLDLARTGDSKSVWTLIRLLRSHTPLKIALSKSWVPIPDASEKALVRYYPEPRTSDCPDPHAALEMIHLIAVSLACSKRLSPRRSYSLVHWLYVFLVKHNAPVKPTLARAMYHAGVERFRRQGLRVAPTQYAYIFDVVEEVEGPDVAADLMDLPRMEHRISRYDEEGHYSN